MKYYTCARTSDGFLDFTADNVYDIPKKLTIKQNRADAHHTLCMVYDKIGKPCEELMAPGYTDIRSGLIYRDMGVAILTEQEEEENCGLYECYREARKIHDEWERLYIARSDYDRLGSYFTRQCCNILGGRQSASGGGREYKRFFGTVASGGGVNYIDELTLGLSKRYFIKGRPGTGKSTFLKQLGAGGKALGFDIEKYCCSFDAGSLDMVIIRELSVCVFDSTPPHEKFPSRKGDEILDFYNASGLDGTDEALKAELEDVKNRYNRKMAEAGSILREIITPVPTEPENADELSRLADKIISQM